MALYAGECSRLQWLRCGSNRIAAIPEVLQKLRGLRGLWLNGNRIDAVPSCILERCVELHTLDVRDNPVTMQELREVRGFVAFEGRRKGKLDKIVDARVGVDMAEAADYARD